MKQEPGLEQPAAGQQQQLQHSTWQLPQKPPEQQPRPAFPDISITVTSQDLQGQQSEAAAATDTQQQQQQHTVRPKRAAPSLLRQGHKPPDAAAAAKWLQGEDGELGGAVAVAAGVAGPKQRPQPAPRMAADPSQQAQGLAHWVRVGAEGAAGEAAAGEQQPAVVEAGVPGPQADLVEEEDAMDEEEWI